LFFEGTELEDDRPLLSYNIQTGSIVNLRVRQSSQMQIHIKTLAGRTASLNVQRSDTIKTVKAMIKDKWGTDPDTIQLIYAGKTLDNNQPFRTLADYEVQDGGNLQLGMPSS
jgi:ubiquitin C